jgi:hypothetical protein
MEKNKGYAPPSILKGSETDARSITQVVSAQFRQNPQRMRTPRARSVKKAASAIFNERVQSYETNYRRGGGEIDLILKDGVLRVCE